MTLPIRPAEMDPIQSDGIEKFLKVEFRQRVALQEITVFVQNCRKVIEMSMGCGHAAVFSIFPSRWLN